MNVGVQRGRFLFWSEANIRVAGRHNKLFKCDLLLLFTKSFLLAAIVDHLSISGVFLSHHKVIKFHHQPICGPREQRDGKRNGQRTCLPREMGLACTHRKLILYSRERFYLAAEINL